MHQRGQSTVELVLLMPLFLVLVFLIFEFGRVFGSWLIITNAAREGTRTGIVQTWCNPTTANGTPQVSNGSCSPSDANIQARVQQTAQFLTISSSWCTNGNQMPANATSCIGIARTIDATTTDHVLTIIVLYQVQRLMPISGTVPFLGSLSYPNAGFQIVGTSIMRSEQ